MYKSCRNRNPKKGYLIITKKTLLEHGHRTLAGSHEGNQRAYITTRNVSLYRITGSLELFQTRVFLSTYAYKITIWSVDDGNLFQESTYLIEAIKRIKSTTRVLQEKKWGRKEFVQFSRKNKTHACTFHVKCLIHSLCILKPTIELQMQQNDTWTWSIQLDWNTRIAQKIMFSFHKLSMRFKFPSSSGSTGLF